MTRHEHLVPPPNTSDGNDDKWTVLANTSRVNKSWLALCRRAPENCQRCYEHLRDDPLQSIPRRVFPLRGRRYQGAWEYEVTKGDRVFYVPESEARTVNVYYAGEHPPRAPSPPR